MLYRYVQAEEHGKWFPLPVTSNFQEELEKVGAVRCSVLSVSEILKDGLSDDKVGYLGPLYFDIDVKGDLNLAISSTLALVQKLRELEVPDEGIQVFASGSKGFHVFVPETVFLSSLRPVSKLPLVYMEMARDLYVMGLDFAVYSSGKGRMFRPENGQRPDGKYRVRISLDELDRMTPELYKQLVSAPRKVTYPEVNGHKSPYLQALYDRARKRAYSKAQLRGTALPTEELEPYAEEPPGCVDLLTKYQVNKGVNFNQAGFQLAVFIARAGVPDYKAESLASEMAEHGESSTYDNPVKRKVHLMGLISYLRQKLDKPFTCAAMRSAVGNSACRGCPLHDKDLTGASEVDEDGAVLGVLATHDGYFIKRDKGESRVSTFTLQPREVFLDQPQGEGGSPRRAATLMEVHAKGHMLGTVMFQEEGWRSKAEFLKQLEGIPSIAFLAGDVDVQRIKYAVYRHCGEDEVDEVINVHTAGVHSGRVGKHRVYTYVEPGMSINTFGVQGTHRLQGTLNNPPQVRLSAKPKQEDPGIRQALLSLLRVNSPGVVAQILGWHCAAHLKEHIYGLYRQFPLLNLWGEAGSGKTHTSALFCHLNGVDYWTGGSPLSCSTTTPFPVVETCSSTTTVPRILEEFNESQIKDWMYKWITDVLKAAWDGMAVPRGTLSRSKADGQNRSGARVENYYITSPLVVCSEQAPQKPALRQRSVQVQLTRVARIGCTEAYVHAVEHAGQLYSMARALTFTAIKTPDEWVKGRMEEAKQILSDKLFDRFLFSYATLLTGLDFFNGVAEGLCLSLGEEVDALKGALLKTVEDSSTGMTSDKIWSEVDEFISSLAEMAQLALQNSPLSPMVAGRTFSVGRGNNELLLDLAMAFPMYRKYTSGQQNKPVFSSLRQLEPLLQSEAYFSGKRVVPQMAGVRQVWVLDLEKLTEKGHEVSMWSASA